MKNVIVIEGLDGCGKNTISTSLSEIIQKEKNVLHIAAPNYNIFSGEFISDVLHEKRDIGEDPYILSLPYSINRLENYKLHTDAINHANVIICDRSWMSNVMYQSVRISEFATQIMYLYWIYKTEIKDTFLDNPDITVNIFHLRHEDFNFGRSLLKKRQEESGDISDKFENDTNYQARILKNSDAMNSQLKEMDSSLRDGGKEFRKFFIMEDIYASTREDGLRTPGDIAKEIYNKTFKR